MDAITDIAEQRLEALKLASELGSVTEACRRSGMSRSQLYEWRRRFQADGFEGLRDRPPVHKSHPQTTPVQTVARIGEIAADHPNWGCDQIAEQLGKEKRRVSPPSVQKTLHQAGLGTRKDRWLELERQFAEGEIELSDDQAAFIERQNPAFRERDRLPSAPGELICAATLVLQTDVYCPNLYVHLAVDAHSSFAFGLLAPEKSAYMPVMLFANRVLPFFEERALPIRAVVTSNGGEFFGPGYHAYRSVLAQLDIEHVIAPVGEVNGFAERVKRTIRRELLAGITDRGPGLSFADTMRRFDEWLLYYNTERPSQGWPNYGRTPADVIDAYVRGEG